MTFKPLACALIATSFLTACSTGPVKQKVNNEPVVFTEPEISPPFYAPSFRSQTHPLARLRLLKLIDLLFQLSTVISAP